MNPDCPLVEALDGGIPDTLDEETVEKLNPAFWEEVIFVFKVGGLVVAGLAKGDAPDEENDESWNPEETGPVVTVELCAGFACDWTGAIDELVGAAFPCCEVGIFIPSPVNAVDSPGVPDGLEPKSTPGRCWDSNTRKVELWDCVAVPLPCITGLELETLDEGTC